MTTPAENEEPAQPQRKWYEKAKWNLILTIGIPMVFGILFYFYTQNKKELSGVFISSSPLVQVTQGAPSDIGITYKGAPVSNAAVVQIQIVNSGDQPIEEADFSKPLAIEFAPDVQILDVQVSNQQPPNLGMVISQTLKNRAEIAPILLNSGDSATLTFITTGTKPQLETTKLVARISGVSTIILRTKVEKIRTPKPLAALLLWLSGALILLYILFFIRIIKNKVRITMLPVSKVAVAILMVMYLLVYSFYLALTLINN